MTLSSVLENVKEGLFFVVSAPAGTGKTTLVDMLTKEFPNVVKSISYTTRLPRVNEIPGQDYHFITEEEFKKKIAASDFLEYVNLFGYYYGTSREWILSQQKAGRHVILVIDTQGARLVKNKISATYVFIKPPSIEVLVKRLAHRETETEESISKRLEQAKKELIAFKEYDYSLVNDDLETAYQILRAIVIAETHKVANQQEK